MVLCACNATETKSVPGDTAPASSGEVDFNFGWEFSLSNDPDGGKPQNNRDWKAVNLPHDWSTEASFDSINGEGATGYLPGGLGWYRKRFPLSLKADQTIYLYFDGVYNNTEVWLNGTKLGFHPYGYSPFYYDITDHLRKDSQNNILEVKVDRTRYVDSRWYPGSGIYRNVKLITKNSLHIPVWGTYITTPEVSQKQARVSFQVTVKNNYPEAQRFELLTELYDPKGKKVGQHTGRFPIQNHEQQPFSGQITVENPVQWDTDNPNLYRLVTSIIKNDTEIDRQEIPVGIRTIQFDPEKGFFLNGKNMLIKGVCLHHDGGLTGAAVPDGVWRRRLKKLKEAGCNAIRTAHNPSSESFLDLCDEMGFLVQEEFFDEWDNPKDKRLNQNEQSVDYVTRGYTEYFQEWAERDLKNTMRRDRNHPSIIQWSIGNEIEWTYPRYAHATGFFNMGWQGNYFFSPPPISPEQIKKRYEESPEGSYVLAKTAQKLADWTREMDKTRPVIANCILPSASHVTGYTDALDIVGYSYRRVLYDYGHKLYPDKAIMGTENLGQWHEWKSVIERPFISGLFLWTGIDYMGEANKQWPKKGTSSGLLDMAGFEKPSYHMMKTLWQTQPHVYMTTQRLKDSPYKIEESTGKVVEKNPGAWKEALWGWHPVNEHWNYSSQELMAVEVYSNCEKIELFLNGVSQGIRQLEDFDDRIYKWAVPFKPGKLEAKGIYQGKIVSTILMTASEPASISLNADKKSLTADGYDVSHIVAQIKDEAGVPVKTHNREIIFSVDGEARILGVDNGAPDNIQDYQSNKILTDKGRALLIVQSKRTPSTVTIKAHVKGLNGDSVSISIH